MPHSNRRSGRLADKQKQKILDVSHSYDFKRKLRKKRSRLRRLILKELAVTHPRWYGLDYPELMLQIHRNRFQPAPHEKFYIQQLGESFGCHTCGTFIATDPNQPWTGDHLPPTELKDALRQDVEKHLKLQRKAQYLAPQCTKCSSQQAAVVKKLNSMSTQQARQYLLNINHSDERDLIQGRDKHRFSLGTNCISATGPKVTQSQGRQIQQMGEKTGCHSCGERYPASIYIADHIVPQEFVTTYMEQVFEALGIKEIDWDNLELRPQCPRCSTRQGGKLSHITKQALEFAQSTGITVYK